MTQERKVVTWRPIAIVVGTVGLFGVTLFPVFDSRVNPIVKNEKDIARLLAKARPEATVDATSPIQRVILANRLTLIPGREQIASGYRLTLCIRSSAFSILATPQGPEMTRAFSFFRDESGVVRFEPDLTRPANAASPPW